MRSLRTSDCDIVIVPGYCNSGPDHWQTRWAAKLSNARRVEQDDWVQPRRDAWVARLIETVGACTRPVVLVAHSLGVLTVVQAAAVLGGTAVRGAFLVALPDAEQPDFLPEIERTFAPISCDPLPFPSVLVASRTDPVCTWERAEHFARAWGSTVVDAGDAGHLNSESGHGPWPEGLLRFANFLQKL